MSDIQLSMFNKLDMLQIEKCINREGAKDRKVQIKDLFLPKRSNGPQQSG